MNELPMEQKKRVARLHPPRQRYWAQGRLAAKKVRRLRKQRKYDWTRLPNSEQRVIEHYTPEVKDTTGKVIEEPRLLRRQVVRRRRTTSESYPRFASDREAYEFWKSVRCRV